MEHNVLYGPNFFKQHRQTEMIEKTLQKIANDDENDRADSVLQIANQFSTSDLANIECRNAVAAQALIPWISDVLLSSESLAAYGSDLVQFAQFLAGVRKDVLAATADEVKLFKKSLLDGGARRTTVARKLSVIRGAFEQLAAKGLISWKVARDIAAIKAPPVQKNTTPSLTEDQANALLRAVPTDSLQGVRDLALLETLFVTGCRVSAICRACVGHLEDNDLDHYLHVTEKRGRESRKLLLHAYHSIRRYLKVAEIAGDCKGPLFRPIAPDRCGFRAKHLDRKTPWRLVKHYCRIAGIDPDRLQGRGIGVHSLRKTAITSAIRNGAQMHEVREFAGHSDIRTTERYFVRQAEDADAAARKIRIRNSIE